MQHRRRSPAARRDRDPGHHASGGNAFHIGQVDLRRL